MDNPSPSFTEKKKKNKSPSKVKKIVLPSDHKTLIC